MTWTLNNIRIFPQDLPDSTSQVVARLQPISGGTVYHTFGYEKSKLTMKCKVVGEADIASLKALEQTGSTYVLYNSGVFGSRTVYVSAINAAPLITISQTIRTDLACDSTVYDVSIEMFEA